MDMEAGFGFTWNETPATVDNGHVASSPQSGTHHHRAHSDNAFRLSDLDELINFDPFDFDLLDVPSPFRDPPNDVVAPPVPPVPVEEPNGQNSGPSGPVGSPVGHLRSLSVDSDFSTDAVGLTGAAENVGGQDVSGEKPATNVAIQAGPLAGNDAPRKALTPQQLAELSRTDPRRAKRIIANRQSAARSKERKTRYASELEEKVKTLQVESSNISTQLTMLQKNNSGMRSENKELTLRIEAMNQQAKLREALNESLKEELQRLKIENSQTAAQKAIPLPLLVSQFASQLALRRLANSNTPPQLAQRQPQLSRPPSFPDQPFNRQLANSPPQPTQQEPQINMPPLFPDQPFNGQLTNTNTPPQPAQQEPQLDMPPLFPDQPFDRQPGNDFSYFNLQN